MKTTLFPTPAPTVMAVAVAVVVAALVVGSVTCDCQKETVVTYNVGLTTTVHGYQERRSAVMEAIEAKVKANDVDVMCLQELWFEEDIKNLLGRVSNAFPYHFSALHDSVGKLRADDMVKWWQWPKGWSTSPCSSLKLVRFMVCMGLHCRNAQHQRRCMMEECSESLDGLSQDCRSCVAVASSGATDITAKCSNVLNEFNRINHPGLVILSKHPLTDVRYQNYHPGVDVLLERGYIQAKTAQGLTYVCTHLSSQFAYYFEAKLPQFTSFEEEQRDEIQTLNKTFHGTPNVLMGDLNTGPARNETGFPVLEGELPRNMDLLTSQLHYHNPYLQRDGRCTYCPSENPVLKAEHSQYATIAIDHVLTSPGVTVDSSSGQRVFDDVNAMLSDHFGVQLDVCLP